MNEDKSRSGCSWKDFLISINAGSETKKIYIFKNINLVFNSEEPSSHSTIQSITDISDISSGFVCVFCKISQSTETFGNQCLWKTCYDCDDWRCVAAIVFEAVYEAEGFRWILLRKFLLILYIEHCKYSLASFVFKNTCKYVKIET